MAALTTLTTVTTTFSSAIATTTASTQPAVNLLAVRAATTDAPTITCSYLAADPAAGVPGDVCQCGGGGYTSTTLPPLTVTPTPATDPAQSCTGYESAAAAGAAGATAVPERR